MNKTDRTQELILIIRSQYDCDVVTESRSKSSEFYRHASYYILMDFFCMELQEVRKSLLKSRDAVLDGYKKFKEKALIIDSLEYDFIQEVSNAFKLKTGFYLSLKEQEREDIKLLFENKMPLSKQQKIDSIGVDFLDLILKIPLEKIEEFSETRLKPYLAINKL